MKVLRVVLSLSLFLGSAILLRAQVPDDGSYKLTEQIRLSLAQIESKKTDPNPSKKLGRKAPTVVKRKPQKVLA